jgi:hypothetical protein
VIPPIVLLPPPSKELIKDVYIFLVSHIKTMLVVCYDIHPQLVMNSLCLVHLVITSQSVAYPVYILINQSDDPLSFRVGKKTMDLKCLDGYTKFF